MNISQSLRNLLEENHNFSDLLFKTGETIIYRLPTGYTPVSEEGLITHDDIMEFLSQVNIHSTHAELQESLRVQGGHLDFAVSFEDVRFRCNLFAYGGDSRWGICLRKLNDKIPLLEDLALPDSAKKLADRPTGLILCTGATGSGKSTTLASIVDSINRNKAAHIITIEDPIEYLQYNKKSSVTQREIGTDVSTFENGLRGALREDPDVILIGEIRDKETCIAALTAAETGHLVLSTLHTTSATKTVERLLDFFEGDEKKQMQNVVSSVLAGVISQVLVTSQDGKSRVLIAEVLINTKEIETTIRSDKLQQLPNAMQNGIKDGQCLMNKELVKACLKNTITAADARSASYDQAGFDLEFKNART